MLRELHIQNLAVIADARIELSAGLNCFTGATGAGKSLVIGAVSVLLGLRSAGEMLRRGADEGRVAGVFELADADLRRQIEAVCDFKFDDDAADLLLTRPPVRLRPDQRQLERQPDHAGDAQAGRGFAGGRSRAA